MKALQYRTTNRTRALAFVATLRAAGFDHRKKQAARFATLPRKTFSTSTFRSCGPKPVYEIRWAYNSKGPFPPRRKLGRDLCSECRKRRSHARGLCAVCYQRYKYRTDAEYRARVIEKSRETHERLYRDDQWRKRKLAYSAKWAKAKRARLRAEREAA